MFLVQVWRISNGKGGSSHPHFLRTDVEQSDTERIGGLDQPGPTKLKEDEVRILPQDRWEEPDFAEDAGQEVRQIDIPPAWLDRVKDNSLGIRPQEADAYYRILAQVASIPARDLQAKADPDALYVNLMASPEKYRGRPVAITGEVVNLYEYTAGENRYGVTRLYDAWILTPDSGNQPYRVVCQSIPADLKPGEKLHQSVRVTGCFFKKEAYESQGRKVHVAPVLLAGRLSRFVSPYAPPPVDHLVPWMIGVITVIGLAMLATVIGFALSDTRSQRWQAPANVSAADAAAFSRIDHRLSIAESLRRLENDEPLEEPIIPRESTNGHGSTGNLPDELIELPTPFPPTRAPRRWDEN